MGEFFKIASTDIQIYRGKLVLIVSNDPIRVTKLVGAAENYYNDEHLYAHSCIMNFKGYQGFVIILNPESKYRKLYYGTVSHEIYHTVAAIATARDIQPDWDNDESMAYLCEWIADFVFTNLKKWNIELKTN